MTQNVFSLEGKAALVTGAARGLGETIAHALSDAGAKVFVTDILDDLAIKVVADINAKGGQAAFKHHDVTVEADWEAACSACVDQLGGLDILINNAGVEVVGALTETSLETFQFVQRVNVEGTFLGIKHAVRTMRPEGAAGKGGSIINLSSIAGTKGFAGLNAYCTSKGAVALLTKSAAVECAALQYGIRVNSVHPGLIETELGMQLIQEFLDQGLAAGEYEEVKQGLIDKFYPMGFGEPSDVSNAVLMLAGDAAKWINGEGLAVDGGAAV